MLRGTLRYPGFCEVINAWKEIGILDETPVHEGCNTWLDYFNSLLKDEEGDLKSKIKSRCFSKVIHYEKLSNEERENKYNHVIDTMNFFSLLDPQTKVLCFLNIAC